MNVRTFTILYFLLAVVEISADMAGLQWLVYITKPLIMLSLSTVYYSEVRKKMDWQDQTILVAFAFSLLGDVFLMLGQERFFIFGLGSFLIAHLCYIFVFSLKYKTNILGRLAFLIYGLAFVIFLKKHLPESLFLPILFYTFTISTMGMRASERQTTTKSHQWVLLGAIFFIISDSLIAVNKFVMPLPYSTLLVMGTYVAAQYLIAFGFLARRNP